ncbi:MAG: hypothetical protein ACHP9T_13995 [Caulobacterales bacterium]
MSQRSNLVALATGLLLFATAGQAGAAACRDAKGHFTACPAPVAKAAAERCRSAAGKFVSCSAMSAVAAGAPAAAIVPAGPTASAAPMAAAGGPNCKKGKRCGAACISVKDVCHK